MEEETEELIIEERPSYPAAPAAPPARPAAAKKSARRRQKQNQKRRLRKKPRRKRRPRKSPRRKRKSRAEKRRAAAGGSFKTIAKFQNDLGLGNFPGPVFLAWRALRNGNRGLRNLFSKRERLFQVVKKNRNGTSMSRNVTCIGTHPANAGRRASLHLMRCSDGAYYVVKFINNPQHRGVGERNAGYIPGGKIGIADSAMCRSGSRRGTDCADGRNEYANRSFARAVRGRIAIGIYRFPATPQRLRRLITFPICSSATWKTSTTFSGCSFSTNGRATRTGGKRYFFGKRGVRGIRRS